jgi:methionine aminopeptidase
MLHLCPGPIDGVGCLGAPLPSQRPHRLCPCSLLVSQVQKCVGRRCKSVWVETQSSSRAEAPLPAFLRRYGVIRDFVGHGVGQLFHSAPTIVHYRNNYPGVMQVRRLRARIAGLCRSLLGCRSAGCCIRAGRSAATHRAALPRQVNQTFTIEPMIVEGSIKTKMWADKWTAVTDDAGLAAQYEHTLLITPNGVEILTVS